jgi:hypothetical protein
VLILVSGQSTIVPKDVHSSPLAARPRLAVVTQVEITS